MKCDINCENYTFLLNYKILNYFRNKFVLFSVFQMNV